MEIQLMSLRRNVGYRNRDSFANAIGINVRMLRAWESDRYNMFLARVCEITDVLSCSLDELAGRREVRHLQQHELIQKGRARHQAGRLRDLPS